MRSPEKHPHRSTETGKGHPESTTVHMADAGSPFDNPEGSGRSGPIRRLVSPGGRSAFHGLQVPPTTGNLANPVTDNFQYIRFGYSMQTIGHLFTYSSQSMTRPKKKPSARGNAPKAVVTTGQLWQFPIYHRTGRLANRDMRKGLPHRIMDMYKKERKTTYRKGRVGFHESRINHCTSTTGPYEKPRDAAESEEQRHHGSDCLKLSRHRPSYTDNQTI